MNLYKIRLILLGISVACVYWVIESLIHFLFINHGSNFIENLIPLDFHEFWMRSLIFISIILSSICLQMFNKVSNSKALLKISEKKYREAYTQAEFYKDLLSHDINNILQNIKMSIEISEMIRDDVEHIVKSNEMMGIIKNQVVRGSSLISNVRKITNLSKDDKNNNSIDIKCTLENAIDQVYTRFQNKPIDIKVKSTQNNFVVKAGDLLIDAFENILLNGAMHNNSDIIKISVELSKMQMNGFNFIKVEFIDNGIGISDDEKEKIFNKSYEKGKSSRGMGIGVSLVINIINQYEGKIWVENRVPNQFSKGSKFVVLLKEVEPYRKVEKSVIM